MPFEISDYREIWAVDFEFHQDENLHPVPVCLVAHELKSGRVVRQWQDEFGAAPPYSTGPDCLFVAFYASAEIGCHLALHWPVPERILDLFTEHRCATNGLPLTLVEQQQIESARKSSNTKPKLFRSNGLLGALAYHDLPHMDVAEKGALRDLILTGGPWDADQRAAILEYCESDVNALGRLLPAMAPTINLPFGLLRGRYMAAVARMERAGVPLDVETLRRLQRNWDSIKQRLVAKIDGEYGGVFEGNELSQTKFADYLNREHIAWPLHDSGKLKLDKDTRRDMAKSHPQILPLEQLMTTLGTMRLNALEVGADDRNRTLLSPFSSRTGRNQPSNSKFIYGPSVWMRGLIKPQEGYGVAYLDWKQQEFGIAAALSGDKKMWEAYTSGDPYLAFAKLAGAAPDHATKASHSKERKLFKQCVLAVTYGQGADGLAARIGQPPIAARELLALHRRTYAVFWQWADKMLTQTHMSNIISTCFGWNLHVGMDPNPRSLGNFPMQAHGSELLRLACCMGTEAGIEIVAPVHDALLIVAPLDRLDEDVRRMGEIMSEASEIVLDGFRLDSDAEVVRYPDRYMDEDRGRKLWDDLMGIVDDLECEEKDGSDRCQGDNTPGETGVQ